MTAQQPAPERYLPARGDPGAISSVLFLGDLTRGSTAEMRRRALQQLGFAVTSVATCPQGPGWWTRKLMAASFKAGHPVDLTGANQAIVELGPKHDIVWIDKGISIRPRTLSLLRRLAPRALVIGYSPDNMAEPAIASKYFRSGLPGYDAFITTKSFGVHELFAIGARRVVYSPSAYDPDTHRPHRQPEDSMLDVGFVGFFEEQRARSIIAVAQSGIRVDVFGLGWERLAVPLPKTLTVHGQVLGDDYARTVCRFRIALCFLRKLSRDLHTQRTMEIPACGVFMLAERSVEHSRMFAEGVEADFFGNDVELVDKAGHWLARDADRRKIAAAGHRRVSEGRCSYAERIADALAEIGIPTPNRIPMPAHGE